MKTQLVCTVICSLLMSVLAVAQEPVHFEDSNLQAAVEGELGISNPSPIDMLALTYLNAESRGIVDLTGLEYASDLETLLLGDNQITNISPLQGLHNVWQLNLQNNKIVDVTNQSIIY